MAASRASTSCFDAIVVGGGHAGIEAARALVSMGHRTALVSLKANTIGAMSCNPAIGGVAKSHLVFEIDALGGMMGHMADRCAIQSRRLNMNKGPAVRSTRVQCDKDIYMRLMSHEVTSLPGLTVVEGEVAELHSDGDRVDGLSLKDGTRLFARAIVISSGTFMRSIMFCGEGRSIGGRFGDPSAEFLSSSIASFGHRMKRLKTGTPARLDAKTICFDALQAQWGDPEQRRFSWRKTRNRLPQVCCFLTYTNERTHEIIRANFEKSPLFSGDIQGVGPRYCPSVEDKVKRFADRERHQVFLEPEGLSTDFVYPNGMSTSLPANVQLEFLRTIQGLERVELKRPGYAVEYDSIDPTDLDDGFQSRFVKGLFFAGQINRTSGYEEAAAQGLWAGLNAGRALKGQATVAPDRTRSYMETLVWDLTRRGTEEPYRLFTSRSEYRLMLREDNAHERLFELAQENGLLGQDQVRYYTELMESFQASKSRLDKHRVRIGPDRVVSLSEYLRRPEVTWESICEGSTGGLLHGGENEGSEKEFLGFSGEISDEIIEKLEVEVKYEGYLRRQEAEVAMIRRLSRLEFPEGFDVGAVPSVSNETIELFKKHSPRSLSELSAIPGVTPASILAIGTHLKGRPDSGGSVSRETITF